MDRNKRSRNLTKSKFETGGGLFKTRGLKRGRLFKPSSLGAQFSLAEKKKVLQAVKKYDVDEVGLIQAEFLPHRTRAEVKVFLGQMILKAASHVEPTEKMPIELWARMAEDLCSGVHDWSPVLAEVFDKIASEEVHASKLNPEDPDWPLMYEYIACQLRGDEPPPVGQIESLILLDLIDALLERVNLLDISQQRPLMERKYRLLSRGVRRTNRACAFKLGRRALQEDLREKKNELYDLSAEAGNATVQEGCITESDPSHSNPSASAMTSLSDALVANDEAIFNRIRDANMYTLNPFDIPAKYLHLKLRDNTANGSAAAQTREASLHINYDTTQAIPPSVTATTVMHDCSSTADVATGIRQIDADPNLTAKQSRKRRSISASSSVDFRHQLLGAVNAEVQAVVSPSSIPAEIAVQALDNVAKAEEVSLGSKARKRRKTCTDAGMGTVNSSSGVVRQEAAELCSTEDELVLVYQSAVSAEIAVRALDNVVKAKEVSLGSKARKRRKTCTDAGMVTVNSSSGVGQEATELCSTQTELLVETPEAPIHGTVDGEKYPKQRSTSKASFESLDSAIFSTPQMSTAVLTHCTVTHSSAHTDENGGITSQSVSSGISVETTNAVKRGSFKIQSAKANASSSVQNQEAGTSKAGDVHGILVKEKQVADLAASGSKSHVTGLAAAQLLTEAAKFVSGRVTRLSKSANTGTIAALQSATEYDQQTVCSSLRSVTDKMLAKFPLTSNNAAANGSTAQKWRSKPKEGRSLSPMCGRDADVLLRCSDCADQLVTETQQTPTSYGVDYLSVDATSRSTATATQQQRKSKRQSAKSQFVKQFQDQGLARCSTPEPLHPTVETGEAKMLAPTVDAVLPLNSTVVFPCSEPLHSSATSCQSTSADATETKKPVRKREPADVSKSQTSDAGKAKQRRAQGVSGVTAIDTLTSYQLQPASLPVVADNTTSERRLVIQVERLSVDTDNNNSSSGLKDSKNSRLVSVQQVISARVHDLEEQAKCTTTVGPSPAVEVNDRKSFEKPAKRYSSASSARKHTRCGQTVVASPLGEQNNSDGDNLHGDLAAIASNDAKCAERPFIAAISKTSQNVPAAGSKKKSTKRISKTERQSTEHVLLGHQCAEKLARKETLTRSSSACTPEGVSFNPEVRAPKASGELKTSSKLITESATKSVQRQQPAKPVGQRQCRSLGGHYVFTATPVPSTGNSTMADVQVESLCVSQDVVDIISDTSKEYLQQSIQSSPALGASAALLANQQFPKEQSSPAEQNTVDMLAQPACAPRTSLDMSYSGTVLVVKSPTMFQNSVSTGRHQVKRLQIQRQSVIDIPPITDFCNVWNA